MLTVRAPEEPAASLVPELGQDARRRAPSRVRTRVSAAITEDPPRRHG